MGERSSVLGLSHCRVAVPRHSDQNDLPSAGKVRGMGTETTATSAVVAVHPVDGGRGQQRRVCGVHPCGWMKAVANSAVFAGMVVGRKGKADGVLEVSDSGREVSNGGL